jgi:hypothetical protein
MLKFKELRFYKMGMTPEVNAISASKGCKQTNPFLWWEMMSSFPWLPTTQISMIREPEQRGEGASIPYFTRCSET